MIQHDSMLLQLSSKNQVFVALGTIPTSHFYACIELELHSVTAAPLGPTCNLNAYGLTPKNIARNKRKYLVFVLAHSFYRFSE